MVRGDGYLKVVGLGGTLRENSASLGALRRSLAAAEEAGAKGRRLDDPGWLVVDLAGKIEVYEPVGAVA